MPDTAATMVMVVTAAVSIALSRHRGVSCGRRLVVVVAVARVVMVKVVEGVVVTALLQPSYH
jgi:hypothetical protein